MTGEGLAEALKGASVVVDVSNSPSFEDAAVLKFFETSTRNLLTAETQAGVGHHVALSVVGTERLLESGYFRAKSAQETLIKESSTPYSIVQATQFFEFVKSIAADATDRGTFGWPVSSSRSAAEDVADALAGIAVGAPVNGHRRGGGARTVPGLTSSSPGARSTERFARSCRFPQARYYGAELASAHSFRATTHDSARRVLKTGAPANDE